MSQPCTQVDGLLTASRRGSLSADQHEHAKSCPECTDALLLEAILREEGVTARAESTPPTLDRVVVELRGRMDAQAARRVRRLNLGLRAAGAGLSGLGVLVSVLWGARAYGSAAGGWIASTVGSLASGLAAPASTPAELLTAVATMTLAALSYGLWSSWVEE